MKSSIKIIGLLLVGLFFLKNSNSNFNNYKSKSSESIDKNQYISNDDFSAYFCGIQNKIVTSSITFYQTTDFKTYAINFSSIYGVEKLLFSTYIQYISNSNSFIKKFRKSDIIFPFHYFW